MDNKETIVRETHYTYDENEKLTSMTVHETITNPIYDDGELLTESVEVIDSGITFHDVAMAITGAGLCLTAIAGIVKRR